MAPNNGDDEARDPVFVALIIEVSRAGTIRVVAGNERPGRPIVSELPVGAYAVSVERGRRVVLVESLADPFEAHSFGGTEDPARGHAVVPMERAQLKVMIPDVRLDRIPSDLFVRLLRLRDAGLILRLNPEALEQLRGEGRVEEIARIDGVAIASQLAERPTNR